MEKNLMEFIDNNPDEYLIEYMRIKNRPEISEKRIRSDCLGRFRLNDYFCNTTNFFMSL